ncbi:MAG: hypothetical protein KAS07_01665 [Candidatus Pacebacteria bacterium]|nr:hypothetical protein [Candidatus Paceibacterota bacterium]
MKRIDLHIHTVPADGKDASFDFDLAKFQEYTDALSIDAVAITNHNLFDLEQFKEMAEVLQNIVVFPGIEIDFEDGHLLLISENVNLDDFSQKCESVKNEIAAGNQITIDKLRGIFIDLNGYLLIPHYDKKPKVRKSAIDSLKDHIFTGEVQSPKRFHRLVKEKSSLTPVLFSDARISNELDFEKHQGKQTFVKTNANPLTLASVIAALKDKDKVFLTDSEQHDFFQVFRDGQELSYGLNVVLGRRSSGKTHLLNKLQSIFDKDEDQVKYIEQGELVKIDEDEFNKMLEKERSDVREKYLATFRSVVDDVVEIDRRTTHYEMQEYTESLVKFAKSEELQDEFSKAVLFKETPFSIRTNEGLEKVIKATKLLLENKTYEVTIKKYISEDSLSALLDELKNEYKKKNKERIKKLWVNELVETIAQELQTSSSSPSIKHNDIDFYAIKIEREKIKRFNAIVKAVKKDLIIDSKSFGGKFAIKAQVGPFTGAQELRDESKTRNVKFSDAFKQYESPFTYLGELKKLSLEKASLYRYFCKVRYHVLNEYDKPVSGGERSEFNLLKALQDARQFEMLLIDEPESSFDNVFLKDNVNKVIKDISKELPVIVVTHNNTVGMLMQPDYILYTSREIIAGDDEYYLYSGSPGDTEFKTADGTKNVSSHAVLLDSLEAGEDAYSARNQMYENFKK